jgi:Putative RNA methylase family UPF0020
MPKEIGTQNCLNSRRTYGRVRCDWNGSAATTESTLHQLSPYIGKTKSSMAASLISQFTKKGEMLYDPFSGSGTLALEAWFAGRRVVANDMSPYAELLTRAKLFPRRSLKAALRDISELAVEAVKQANKVDLREVPRWVRQFFHQETLRETIAWTRVLINRRRWFLLASLLGILHHQRPGFLSFPSSHTVPYLRAKKFPRYRFPALYEYRSVRDRLESKVRRAFRRLPALDFTLTRACHSDDAGTKLLPKYVDAIITSPPYMRLLDYGRDNRLRLWFLGTEDWRKLDKVVSPTENAFLVLMKQCFATWKMFLKPGGYCVLIVGDECSRSGTGNLSREVSRIATEEVGGYRLIREYTETIPDNRRVRRGNIGSASESILVLKTFSNDQRPRRTS